VPGPVAATVSRPRQTPCRHTAGTWRILCMLVKSASAVVWIGVSGSWGQRQSLLHLLLIVNRKGFLFNRVTKQMVRPLVTIVSEFPLQKLEYQLLLFDLLNCSFVWIKDIMAAILKSVFRPTVWRFVARILVNRVFILGQLHAEFKILIKIFK